MNNQESDPLEPDVQVISATSSRSKTRRNIPESLALATDAQVISTRSRSSTPPPRVKPNGWCHCTLGNCKCHYAPTRK